MFKAFKKLVKNEGDSVDHGQAAATGTTGGGKSMQSMAPNLQKKFAKGVQYNMKVVIKGDRNVGKTALFERLQGMKFKAEYIPTQEIQVASIQWNYKATDDVVKVEVWDVVDKGVKRKPAQGLKIENACKQIEEAALDAEFVDIYKGTHGVIIMIDITKQWTFEYVEREMSKVPAHLPVLVLANHRDMGHHRVVRADDVKYYIEHLNRGVESAPVRYAEASMQNGFGLKFLHKFFNIPFLQLQRETLLGQLETNARETGLTHHELDVLMESDEQNYDLFLESLTCKRREIADKHSPRVSLTNGETPMGGGQNIIPQSKSMPHLAPHAANTTTPQPQSQATTSPPAPQQQQQQQPSPTPGNRQQQPPPTSQQQQQPSPPTSSTPQQQQKPPATAAMMNVDDFMPVDELDASFLDDIPPVTPAAGQQQVMSRVTGDVSDDDAGDVAENPMVAGFQDDVDSDDASPAAVAPSVTVTVEHDTEGSESEGDVTGGMTAGTGGMTAVTGGMTAGTGRLTAGTGGMTTAAGGMTNGGGSGGVMPVAEISDTESEQAKLRPTPYQPPPDTQQESSVSVAAPAPVSVLQFEDLSILEKGLAADISEDSHSSSQHHRKKKKKKHKDRDKDSAVTQDTKGGSEGRHRKKKERGGAAGAGTTGEEAHSKQRRKKKDGAVVVKDEVKGEAVKARNELEEFLAGGDGYESF